MLAVYRRVYVLIIYYGQFDLSKRNKTIKCH